MEYIRVKKQPVVSDRVLSQLIIFSILLFSFLQMLSTKASQNVTYHCQNSVAFHHARRDNKRKAITLQSWNDLEIKYRGKFRYNVLSDDCQVL